jgi:3-hydroxyacyl-[acyl-carrier-protein] dehydratase
MPPPVILDPRTLDFANLVADRDAIMRVNPQRHEFGLLDGVVLADAQRGIFAGFHDVRPDAWWVRGHVPGRPLMPGVLMIEIAAQLSSFLTHQVIQGDKFVGLAGVDEVKYRGAIVPPCRFVVVGQLLEIRPRRIRSASQGFVDGTMVFEAMITGMIM